MRQLELTPRRCTYVAVTANGDSAGERMLPADASYFPQPKAADDPAHNTYDVYDSCAGTIHVYDVEAAKAA